MVFCLDLSWGIHLQEQKLFITTTRDMKIVIFSLASTVLVRFTFLIILQKEKSVIFHISQTNNLKMTHVA